MSRPSFSRLSALSCLAFLPVLAACKGTQGSTASPAARPKLTVRVAPVIAQDVVYEIKAPGTLEAEELVQITAQVEGAVTGVRFHEGDAVGRGTVLLRIDPDRYQLELKRAEANYQRTLADARRAAADLAPREGPPRPCASAWPRSARASSWPPSTTWATWPPPPRARSRSWAGSRTPAS